jgi:uncharacterized protein (DUF1778 family)
MSTEHFEYEDDTVPQHVAHFLLEKARSKATKVLDDAEMRELEPGQYF